MALTKMFGVLSMAGIVSLTAYGMGCSSSTKGGSGTPQGDSGAVQTGDSGNKTDGSVKDTGAATDATGTQSDAIGDSGDSGSTCAASTPFMMLPWAPPTPFGQGKCTDAQVTAYVASLGMTNTSGSTTCDACLQTDISATMHGPVITDMGQPISINFGGCIANETKLAADQTATGCGAEVNNFQDCLQEECQMCPDFGDGGMDTQECIQAACTKEDPGMSCQTELMGDGGIQLCLGQINGFFEAWCGGAAPTDGGGTPEAGPTDGGAEQ